MPFVCFYKILSIVWHPTTRELFILIQANADGELKAYYQTNILEKDLSFRLQDITATAWKLSREDAMKIFHNELISL